MDERPVRHNIHSTHVYTPSGDAVIVKERLQYKDGRSEPNLAVFDNPRRSFYLTKPKYRTYAFKPEQEPIERLDKYTVYNHEMKLKLAELIGMRPSRYIKNSALFRSPYIFGADIDIESLIKMNYLRQSKGHEVKPVCGFLDIETNIASGEIILISFIMQGHVYTTIREPWLYKVENKQRIKVGMEEITKTVHELLAKHCDIDKYKIHLKIVPTEIELITGVFSIMHKLQPDFVGIWNMSFDIGKIIPAIEKRSKFRLPDILCDPKLDPKYKQVKYYVDRSKTGHYTLKWDWLYAPASFQFIDSLGLYSQNRRTQGYLGSYKLDNILRKHCGTHKMEVISDNHTFMQTNHFPEYVAYNIFDVIGLDLLENANNDILAMHMNTRVSPPAQYARSTNLSTNDTYYDRFNSGYVMSARSSEDRYLRLDKLLPGTAGGTVLSPSTVDNEVGVRIR